MFTAHTLLKIIPTSDHDMFAAHKSLKQHDENQQAPLKDPLHVPVRPITRERSRSTEWADSRYLG
jgi:hypothetical protein